MIHKQGYSLKPKRMKESLVSPTFQANSFSSFKTGHNSALPGNLPWPPTHGWTLLPGSPGHLIGCLTKKPPELRRCSMNCNIRAGTYLCLESRIGDVPVFAGFG